MKRPPQSRADTEAKAVLATLTSEMRRCGVEPTRSNLLAAATDFDLSPVLVARIARLARQWPESAAMRDHQPNK